MFLQELEKKKQRIIGLSCPYIEELPFGPEFWRRLLSLMVHHEKEKPNYGLLVSPANESAEEIYNFLQKHRPNENIRLIRHSNISTLLIRGNGSEQSQFDYPLDFVIVATHPKYYRQMTRFVKHRLPENPAIVIPFNEPAGGEITEMFCDDTPLERAKVVILPPGGGSKRLDYPIKHFMEYFEIVRDNSGIRPPYFDLRAISKICGGKKGDGRVCLKGSILSQKLIDEYYREHLKYAPGFYTFCTIHHPLSTDALMDVKDADIIYLTRDPRDMITAIFHRFQYDSIEHELGEFMRRPKEEVLLGFVNGFDYARKDYFMKWPSIDVRCRNFLQAKQASHIFTIDYSDLRYNPEPIYKQMIDYLHFDDLSFFPITDQLIKETIHRGTFAFQTDGKREEGEDHKKIFGYHKNRFINCRKGITGDWKNHFTPKIKERVKELAGDLLIELGYEEDHNW